MWVAAVVARQCDYCPGSHGHSNDEHDGGVDPDASDREVESAFRQLAKELAPSSTGRERSSSARPGR
ncbi:hypothetical protein C447_09702 [Halococcus hamelinensis 100A6]|uniref:Uncharacterized protein n=1 Tax=Halococcus hamelinensis 100A6 TaxID=1132509 RepID=M0M1E3_9EURY|nr:hypothetical protein C447_09702 [Halococcus hamelinensis 100A6]